MDILIMAGQLILGLSILVGLHELGHMLAAKWFGMRVEQYAIGFPPKIWKKQIGETEYSIGAIPLGGFVKISGMIDESLDMSQMSSTPEPWEFRAKPAWQRLIVMLGGIIVNVITGVVIFVALTFYNGGSYLSVDEVNKNGIVAYPLAQELGLQTGDKILKVNGKQVDDFSEVVSSEVFLESNSSYTVQRGGQTIDIQIPNNFVEKLSDKKNAGQFIEPIQPFKIDRVAPGSPAADGGLKQGDYLTSINGKPIRYYHEFKQAISGMAKQSATLGISRDGKPLTILLKVSDDGTIGFYPQSLLNYTSITYSFGESLSIGTQRAFGVIYDNIRGFAKIFKGEVSASKALSGPIGIAQMFGSVWDWDRFWALTGLLSMALAFMNALPIPALDGGHATLLMYEIVSGRKPSDKFLEVAQKVGMVLLLGLMAFAIGNDVYKAIF